MSELKPCPWCWKPARRNSDGDRAKCSDDECSAATGGWLPIDFWQTRASPWVKMETPPTDHHPGYLVAGLDEIPHKAYWDGDRWIYEGAGFEANAFAYWMLIPELPEEQT